MKPFWPDRHRRLAVELYVQLEAGPSDRQCLRIPASATIREILRLGHHEPLIERIASGELGLGCQGNRARLDDPVLVPCRIEVMLPITADAKAWRHQRVAARRADRDSRNLARNSLSRRKLGGAPRTRQR